MYYGYSRQPRYSQKDTRRYLEFYKQNPDAFSKSQVNTLRKYAEYYRIPFAENEVDHGFSIIGAIKEAAEGYLTGFTTFEIGKPSGNKIENIFRKVGQLAGFIGVLPTIPANLMAKMGKLGLKSSSTLFKAMKGLAKASGKYSLPMWGASKITPKLTGGIGKVAKVAAASQGKAVKAVGKFLASPAAKSVIQQSMHLGAASGISSWQHGVDEMAKSFMHGSTTGLVFSQLGNIFGKYGLVDPGSEVARRGLNMVAHSMYTGLPATLRKASTPDQVYEYLLGAYFGSKAEPITARVGKQYANKYLIKLRKSGKLSDVAEDLKFTVMSKGSQEVARKTISRAIMMPQANAIKVALKKRYGMTDKQFNDAFGESVITAAINKTESQIADSVQSPTEVNTTQQMFDLGLKNLFKATGKVISKEMNDAAFSQVFTDIGEYMALDRPNAMIKAFVDEYRVKDVGKTKKKLDSKEIFIRSLPDPKDNTKRKYFKAGKKLTKLTDNKILYKLDSKGNEVKVGRVSIVKGEYYLHAGPLGMSLGANELEARRQIARNKFVDAVPEGSVRWDYDKGTIKQEPLTNTQLFEKVLDKWNEIQPYGAKENYSNKMVDWILKQPEFHVTTIKGNTPQDIKAIEKLSRLWRLKANKRIYEAKVPSQGIDSEGNIHHVKDNRAETGEFWSKKYVPSRLFHRINSLYKKAGLELEDSPVIEIDHGIKVERTIAKDEYGRTVFDNTGNPIINEKKTLVKLSGIELPDEALLKRRRKANENDYYYYGGVSDKDIIHLVKYHPKVLRLAKGESKPVKGGRTLNIYYGTNENADLSNFANRPFSTSAVNVNNVETAFQLAKAGYASSTPKNDAIIAELSSGVSGAKAKRLGRQIENLDVKRWNKEAPGEMKQLIRLSFQQNPDAKRRLVATRNAKLTHTQDKGKWGKLFPKTLMEVRDEFVGNAPKRTSGISRTLRQEFNFIIRNMAKAGSKDPKKQARIIKNIRRAARSSKVSNKQFMKEFISDFYYDMEINGWKIGKEKFIETVYNPDTDFVNDPKGFNRRRQITNTSGIPVSTKLLNEALKGAGKDTRPNGLTVSIVDDYGLQQILKVSDNAVKYPENTDGVTFILPELQSAMNEAIGIPSGGNMLKHFIYSPHASYGALMTKTNGFTIPSQLEKIMRKKGIDVLVFKSAGKQTGARKRLKVVADAKNKMPTIVNADGSKITMDNGMYRLRPEDIRVDSNKMFDKKHFHNPLNMAVQLQTVLGTHAYKNIPAKTIRDMVESTIGTQINGEKKWNDKVDKMITKGYTKKELNDLLENIDKVSLNKLFKDIIHNSGQKKLAVAVLEKMHSISKEEMAALVHAGKTDPKDATYSFQQADQYESVAIRILRGTQPGLMKFLDKHTTGYSQSVINGYVRRRLTRPYMQNSHEAVMRPYTIWDVYRKGQTGLNENSDYFYLGDHYRSKVLEDTRLPNNKITLGKLWYKYQNRKKLPKKQRKVVEELVDNVLVTRVPVEYISGAQSLKFRGFNGYKDFSISLHGLKMKALGGADLDVDTAQIYWGGTGGMKKKWVDMYAAQKKEFYRTNKDGSKSLVLEDKVNPETGRTYLDDKTVADKRVRNLINSPYMKYVTEARKIASQTAYGARSDLGTIVNNRSFIIAGYNELMELPVEKRMYKYKYTTHDKYGNPKHYEVIQRPRGWKNKSHSAEVKNVVDRIKSSLSASIKATLDPMDHDSILPADKMLNIDLNEAFVFEVRRIYEDRPRRKISDERVRSDHMYGLKKAGVTSLFSNFKRSLKGRNYQESRTYSTLERWNLATKLGNEFPNPVSALAQQAKMSSGLDIEDSLLRRVTSKELKALYNEFYSLRKEGKFDKINKVTRPNKKKGKYKFDPLSVVKHKLVDFYLRYNLGNPNSQRKLIEPDNAEIREMMTTDWYKELARNIDSLPSFKKYKNMNVRKKLNVLRGIDIVANDFIYNDINDMTSMITLSATAKKLSHAQIKKVWKKVEAIKKINKKNYRTKKNKRLSRDEVIKKSNEMSFNAKKNMNPHEQQLFDTFMLSSIQPDKLTFSLMHGKNLRTINQNVFNRFYRTQEKIFDIMTNKKIPDKQKKSTEDILKIERTERRMTEEGNRSSFDIESNKKLASRLKFPEIKNPKNKMNKEAMGIFNKITEFMDKHPNEFGSVADLNKWAIADIGKNLTAFTMEDFRHLSNIISDVSSGHGSQTIAWLNKKAKNAPPFIQKAAYYLFPKRIGEKQQSWNLSFKKVVVPYRTEKGEIIPMAIGKTPTSTILDVQKYANFAERMKVRFEEKVIKEFQEKLIRVMPGKYADMVWEAMVSTRIETGVNVESKHKPPYVENYRRGMAIIKKLEGVKHKVFRANGKVAYVSTEKLMDAMEKIHRGTMSRFDKLHRGGLKPIEKYEVKKYLVKGNKRLNVTHYWFKKAKNQEDANAWYNKKIKQGYKPKGKTIKHFNNVKVYNYEDFIRDQADVNAELGKIPDRNISTYALRTITHSMQLSVSGHRSERFRKMLGRTRPKKAGSYGKHFHPHNNFTKSIANKEIKKSINKIASRNDLSAEKKVEEIIRLHGEDIMALANMTKETVDDAMWKVLGPEITQEFKSKKAKKQLYKWWETNIMSASEMKRTGHAAGWDLSPNAIITYIRNESKNYLRHYAQLGIRNEMNKFYFKYKKKYPKETIDAFMDYYRLQAGSMLGFPQVVPERMLTKGHPANIKGTLYQRWSDNNVAKKLNSIGEKLGLVKPDPTQKTDLSALEARMKSWRFDTVKLTHMSTIEAKYQLAALLAHPKVSVNNIYGGTSNTIIRTGINSFKRANLLSELKKINPDWDSWEKIDRAVVESGVIEEFLIYQGGVSNMYKTKRLRGFMDEVVNKVKKDPGLSDITIKEIAKKHGVGKKIIDTAAWFMKTSERKLRRDAYLSQLVQSHKNWDGALAPDHPFIVKQALNGVRATQFMYSASARPMFANTALGKVMTRFQLWSWNSVRFRRETIRKASEYGYRQGTKEFDRFRRMLQIDIFALALSNVFMYSLFESALPAPYGWLQDTADLMFGDEKTRERAFFGSYPGYLKPLQLITPSALRLVGPTINAVVEQDFSEISSYHAWAAFPFGRMGRDLIGENNIFVNPSGILEKTTGFPYRGLIQYRQKLKKMGEK